MGSVWIQTPTAPHVHTHTYCYLERKKIKLDSLTPRVSEDQNKGIHNCLETYDKENFHVEKITTSKKLLMMLTFLSIIFIIDDPFFWQPIVSGVVCSIRDRSPVDGKEWELIIFLWFNIYLRYWYMITSSFYGRNQGSVWSSHPFSMIRYLVKIQAWVELHTVCSCRISAASL